MRAPMLRPLVRLALAVLLVGPVACAHANDPEKEAAREAKKEAKEQKDEAKAAAYAAGLPAWDQAKMTALTKQLATQMEALRMAFRESPEYFQSQSTSGAAEADMEETLRLLEQETASLADRVSKGQGAYQTHGLFEQINSMLDDVAVTSRSINQNYWTDAQLAPFMTTFNDVAHYYGRGPIYDLETMTKIGLGPDPNRRKEGQ